MPLKNQDHAPHGHPVPSVRPAPGPAAAPAPPTAPPPPAEAAAPPAASTPPAAPGPPSAPAPPAAPFAILSPDPSAGFAEAVAGRAAAGSPPTLDELERLFSLPPGPAAEALMRGAEAVRAANFGSSALLYGFVYLSTWCRNNCAFCHYRSELDVERYRLDEGEIVGAAESLAGSGVHLIDLTMGEDPEYLSEEGFGRLLSAVGETARRTGLPVMLSPGVLGADRLARARAAGAAWYALYQETHDRELFGRWRRGQDYDARVRARREAAAAGLLVEDGILVGAGAPPAALARSVAAMAASEARQIRAMGYVRSPGGLPPKGDAVHEELLAIALLRLSRPEALIPASLDVEGLRGLAPRIRAGANVVTSLVPAGAGLAGVASKELDIENRNRCPPRVAEALAGLGLRPADADGRRVLTAGPGPSAGRLQSDARVPSAGPVPPRVPSAEGE